MSDGKTHHIQPQSNKRETVEPETALVLNVNGLWTACRTTTEVTENTEQTGERAESPTKSALILFTCFLLRVLCGSLDVLPQSQRLSAAAKSNSRASKLKLERPLVLKEACAD